MMNSMMNEEKTAQTNWAWKEMRKANENRFMLWLVPDLKQRFKFFKNDLNYLEEGVPAARAYSHAVFCYSQTWDAVVVAGEDA